MNIAKQITAYLSVEVMSKNIFLQPAILYVVLSISLSSVFGEQEEKCV